MPLEPVMTRVLDEPLRLEQSNNIPKLFGAPRHWFYLHTDKIEFTDAFKNLVGLIKTPSQTKPKTSLLISLVPHLKVQ